MRPVSISAILKNTPNAPKHTILRPKWKLILKTFLGSDAEVPWFSRTPRQPKTLKTTVPRPARRILHPESWLDNTVTTLQQDAPPRRIMHGIYAWIAFFVMHVYRNRMCLVGYTKLLYSAVRRSVVKYGGQGQSCQAIELFHITPYVNDLPTLKNPGSWRLI